MPGRFCTMCGEALKEQIVEGRERPYCPSCDTVRWRNPVPVAWTLLQDGGDVLLVKRAEEPESGMWDIPGGFVEYGESLPEAAVRELREETGVRVKPDTLIPHDTVAFQREDRKVVGVVFTADHDLAAETLEAGSDAEAAYVWNREALRTSSERVRPVCRPLLEQDASAAY